MTDPPPLLLLQLVFAIVFILDPPTEAVEEAMLPGGEVPPDPIMGREGCWPCCCEAAWLLGTADAAEDLAPPAMAASKSMMRLPTSTVGQLSLSSRSKLS